MFYFTFYLKKIIINFNTKLNSFLTLTYPRYFNIHTLYFLRKNKTFIKSKYSRTRQWSKVIVYFGLWYGIISVFFLTAYCYRYLFIFSYLWWIIFIFILIIVLKSIKLNIKYFYIPNFWN